MLEVEMKFPAADVAEVGRRLAALVPAAVRIEREKEADHYLNAPDRDFARTDEALRVREHGDEGLVTYKGPKIDKTTKTRREIEVGLGGGSAAIGDALALFRALGFRPTATIRKLRTTYEAKLGGFPVHICVDEVDEVGTFVELEIQAAEDQLKEARTAIQDLAKSLGLGDSERRSYLELYLAKHPKEESRAS
jgi:adenylate cyclase class 2